jgi:SAM-dependent methyltransferase
MYRKQTITDEGGLPVNSDASVKKMDREAYNRYARERAGLHVESKINNEFRMYQASLIPELFKEQLYGVNALLEIGAGRGFPSIIMSERVERAVVLDHNSDPVCGLKAALTTALNEKRTVVPVQGAYETAPFKDGSFDAVVAQSCIHHALQPHTVIQEIFRVLRSGGRLVIIEPCRGTAISEEFSYRHYWEMPGMDPEHMHEHVYTLPEWCSWIQGAGFTGIHMRSTYTAWAASFLARQGFRFVPQLCRLFSKTIDIPYQVFAKRFGHPPLFPHQFTRRLTGFEYYEVMISARKP